MEAGDDWKRSRSLPGTPTQWLTRAARRPLRVVCQWGLGLALLLASADGLAQDDDDEGQDLQLVVDYPYELWNNSGTKIHLVVFNRNFVPVRGAQVLLKGKQLGRTNGHGTFIFTFRAGKDWSGDELVVRKKWRRGKVREATIRIDANHRTPSFGKVRVYLYSDRLVYRPRGEAARAGGGVDPQGSLPRHRGADGRGHAERGLRRPALGEARAGRF